MNVAIIANGDVNDYSFARQALSRCGYVIACDGGLRHCHMLGVTPDCIVGDIDSAPPDILAQYHNVPAHRHNEMKDYTDLEAAIAVACDSGAESILVLGGLGGRFDHQLGNIHALAQAVEYGIPAMIIDERTRVQLVNSHCRLHLQDGNLVTLLPLTTSVEGIETEGLQYPLKNEALTIGNARGLSNVIIAESATVTVKHGLLLIVQTRGLC